MPENIDWIKNYVKSWSERCDGHATHVPLVMDGEEQGEDRDERESIDPSRPGTFVARYTQAQLADVERAVTCAKKTQPVGELVRPLTELRFSIVLPTSCPPLAETSWVQC